MKLSTSDRRALRECLATIEHAQKVIMQSHIVLTKTAEFPSMCDYISSKAPDTDGTIRQGGNLLTPLDRLTKQERDEFEAMLALPASLLGRFLAHH